jgi:hypothetical protein
MEVQRDRDDLELLSFLSDVIDEEGENSTRFMLFNYLGVRRISANCSFRIPSLRSGLRMFNG